MSRHDGSDNQDSSDEALAEYLVRIDHGEWVDRQQFIADHPEAAEELRLYFANGGIVDQAASSSASELPTRKAVAHTERNLRELVEAAKTGKESTSFPESIGRYRVEKLLGSGTFGRVFLAHDDELTRPVAIKVPHCHRVSNAEEAEAYLTEARLVAHLDHRGIVPVYDVGRTADNLCYVVSKYIQGGNLRTRLKQARPSPVEAAQFAAAVAEALHHAHQQGLVHRDIKPANILLDAAGRPYVADFGSALNEQQPEDQGHDTGTPAYMSPEQARGEGHRVDGRADIFALGVVLYEMLSGQRPFSGEAEVELRQQIASGDLPQQMRARLVLLETDPSQATWLSQRILQADPDTLQVLCQTLYDHDELPVTDLWNVAEDETQDAGPRFRAACALAPYDSHDGRWARLGTLVAEELVNQNVLLVRQWKDLLRSKRHILIAPLSAVFRHCRQRSNPSPACALRASHIGFAANDHEPSGSSKRWTRCAYQSQLVRSRCVLPMAQRAGRNSRRSNLFSDQGAAQELHRSAT